MRVNHQSPLYNINDDVSNLCVFLNERRGPVEQCGMYGEHECVNWRNGSFTCACDVLLAARLRAVEVQRRAVISSTAVLLVLVLLTACGAAYFWFWVRPRLIAKQLEMAALDQ